ncbi:MAG: hypothetical protein CSA65_01890 [Proteobacteria bacterium]|nr:MAG: hypothetical protein CSA65_01890 [Pseudomonadota bacterium]
MPTVTINPPKTPVTAGSNGLAPASVPNVCKMPGPPAPFVPTPLPNIGKSGDSPKGYSKTVKIEGHAVAIKGATFGSVGDMASQGTGGGVISGKTHGRCSFIGPGSLDVFIEGEGVHLLGDRMLNNGGSTANTGSTEVQAPAAPAKEDYLIKIDCEIFTVESGWDAPGHEGCFEEQLCAMIKGFNKSKRRKKRIRPSPSDSSSPKYNAYQKGLDRFRARFQYWEGRNQSRADAFFNTECLAKKYRDGKAQAMSPDHVHDAGLNGAVAGRAAQKNLSWAESRINTHLGACMRGYDPKRHGKCVPHPNCSC